MPRIIEKIKKIKKFLSQKIVLVIFLLTLVCLLIGGGFYLLRREKPAGEEKFISPPTPSLKTEEKKIDLGDGITLEKIDSTYKTVTAKPTGFFETGQEADLLLSGVDFDNSGGPLLFNHPGNIASDGKHLLLADRNNNRVLIWNKLPESNTPPDLVLGQENFITNNPGTSLSELNWPVGVATDGTHVLVADTYNDRILIWSKFPTKNGQAADLELKSTSAERHERGAIVWPWAVWTNGEKVIVTSTGASRVLIWNKFPTKNNEVPDVVLALTGKFGTPRSIASDGNCLMIGDHNALSGNQGNFFWKTFPVSDNQLYDFFLSNLPVNTPFLPPTGNLSLAPEKPLSPPPGQSFFSPPVGQPPPLGTPPPTSLSGPNQQNTAPADIFWGGVFTANGSFIHLVGSRLAIWKSFPKNENDTPLLILGGDGVSFSEKVGFSFLAGDGSGAAWAGSKLYLSLSNGNKIVVFNSLPDKSGQGPDFAVGSPNLNVNTLETAFIISNPAPVSNGKSLFVSSDFDRKLYVWKDLPDESSAKPDFVYSLPEGPWDNALFEEKLALAGKGAVYLWQKLPTEGQKPDQIFNDKIGSIKLQNLNGVALDEKYFYLADGGNNKIYIWEGIPQESSEPKFVLNIDSPGRLSSDGRYLIATSTLGGAGGSVKVYKIDELSNNIQPISLGGPGSFNLPQAATVSHGHLFIGDTGFNRVLIWKNIEDALLGKKADVILGETGRMEKAEEAKPKIGKDKLFWPAIPSFDGSFLWLGEFKFSERILRFSVR